MFVRSYYILQSAGKNKRQTFFLIVMRLRKYGLNPFILFLYVNDILDPKHYIDVYKYQWSIYINLTKTLS